MEFLLHLIVGLVLVAPSLSATWDYKTKDTWRTDYPTCAGKSQSPIDIVRDDVEVDEKLPIIDRKIFDTPPTKMTIKNNGETLKVVFDGGYELVNSDLLPFKAKIDHYHLHWGRNAASGGAEHTVDGKQYFGELHAVHYNAKYANVSEAMTNADGLAVFGWFIDVDYPQKNQDFEHLLQLAMTGAAYAGNSTKVSPTFSLETIVPPDLTKYYRYKGSLTTPGCFESVVWTVFEEPIRISEEQATMLAEKFMDNNGDPIQDNFREVQPLNGRQVMKPPPLVPKSAGVSLAASTLLSFTSVLLVLLH